MAFIPVQNTAEVVLQGKQGTADAFNTLYFEQGEPFTVGDLEALLTLVEDWWGDMIAPLVVPQFTMPSMKATSLQTEFAPSITDSDFLVHAGTYAGVPNPAQVSMVVTFRTENRGRSFRGRNYVPGTPQAELFDTSTWQADYIASMTAAYEDLATRLNATPFTHVVVSRVSFGVPRLLGLATPVNAYQARSKVGTQRKRIAGTGS